MAYWNSKFGNLPAPRLPKRLCGYYVTPMFAFRWDQAPKDMAELIGWIPFTMQTQTGSLATTLALKHSTTLPEADLPGVLSRYQPGHIPEICARAWMEELCGERPDGDNLDSRERLP